MKSQPLDFKKKGASVRSANEQLLPTSRWRRAATTVSLLMVIVAVATVMLLSRGVDKELYYVSITADLRRQADGILLNLIEMNANERTFAATHDYDLYRRFFHASKALEDNFLAIEALVVNQPHWQQWFSEVKPGVNKQRKKLTDSILAAQQSAKDSEAQSVPNKNITLVSDHLTALIVSFLDEEEKELAERRSGLDMLRASLGFAAIIAIIATFVLAYAVINRFRRDVRRLRAYQSLLYSENAILEKRVRERTAELEAARTHAEKERHRVELLLQDASHRIGNSLATVSSLLGLQLRRTKNPEVLSALNSARDRIQTIAAAHRRLRLGGDLETAKASEFLAAVVDDVKTGIPAELRERIEICTNFENWHMASRDVTTLGIILGELLTNAVKHAFPDGRSGVITVSFGKLGQKDIQLIVEDNGVGMSPDIENNNPKGLGRLVVQQLAMQFGEKACYEQCENGGTRAIVRLPALSATRGSDETDHDESTSPKA